MPSRSGGGATLASGKRASGAEAATISRVYAAVRGGVPASPSAARKTEATGRQAPDLAGRTGAQQLPPPSGDPGMRARLLPFELLAAVCVIAAPAARAQESIY